MTLLELLSLMRKHLKLVVALPVVFAIAMGIVSFAMMDDTYTARTDMYVLASSNGDTSGGLNSDLSASQMLTNDVSTLLTSERVTSDAAKSLGLKDLNGFDVQVASETTTRVISLSVTGSSPRDAADVANALATSISDVAKEVMNIESVNVIDEAQIPTAPSGPNRPMYVVAAALAGLFIAVVIVVLMDMLDTRVRSAEEVEELLGLSVIGRMPEMKEGR